MRHRSYRRNRVTNRYSVIASTLALVFSLAALCLGGAIADGVFVTSRQIKNGTILSQDIHNGGVKSADIKNGTVNSGDIGNGDVTPADVTMPPPDQIQEPPGDVATTQAPTDFTLLDSVGTYDKQDGTSELEVDWTGTAAAAETGCIFQIRVDGQPSSSSGGEVFIASGGQPSSVSATALFDGLPTGTHSVEIWAKAMGTPLNHSCTVGPASAGVGQTFVVSEQVV